MLTELEGQLEQITYQNEENRYTIGKFRVAGRTGLVTIVGTLFAVSAGETLRLRGEWEKHQKYGPQFRFESYEIILPTTARGIEKYLGSGMIKGIGPVMARRIVDRFGTDTLDIIENDIGRLRAVGGFGSKRIEMIGRAWSDQKDVRDVMVFLQGHDVSPAYATRIYRHYGKDTLRIVREDPYRLADDIFGFGFLTADRIGAKLGIPADSPTRAEAGMLYVLSKSAEDGNVYVPYDPLLDECVQILGIDRDIVLRAFAALVRKRRIIAEDISDHDVSADNKAVYPAELHAAEAGVAHKLVRIFSAPANIITMSIENALGLAEEGLSLVLAENQRTAIREALRQKVLVITGGPGTGKTTIINAIIRIYRKTGRSVLLAAPTGRAAKRLAESTGYEAKTIHRLLEYSPKNGGFKKGEADPLDAHLIVIDEASMIDVVLMNHFLKAVPEHAALIIVGDVDQLPSVGPGNVLRDIIDSRTIPTVRLDEIFRQDRESLIITNAHRINHGEFPLLPKSGEDLQDFYFIEIDDPEKAVEKILHLCVERIPGRFGLDPLSDIQVLTPMHRGVAGAANLNAALQKRLNPSGTELPRGGKVYRSGDKVMQIRNNYDRDVYNGDIGRITAIDHETQELTVDYEGRPVVYDFKDLDEIVPAYAISIHKSQGSEYPAVVMPLLTQHYMLLQRNLLYTGVTRGKRLVVIVGTKKALGIAIRNNKPRLRYTRLRQRLTGTTSNG